MRAWQRCTARLACAAHSLNKIYVEAMNTPEASFDIRSALRSFGYGLYVLTAGRGSAAHAATVTWVTQASMKPRRVAAGVRKDSHIYPVLRQESAFALNVVGEGQEDLAAAFFRFVPVSDRRIAGFAFEDGPATGAPLLVDAVAWLECRVVEEANAGGDHGVFIAEVLAGGVREIPAKPLSLAATGWSYGG